MATSYPTGIDTPVNPTAGDTLASVPHAGQHDNANDAIVALQNKVGTNSSAVTTSLDYKVAQNTTSIATKKTDSMNTNKLLGRGTAGTGAIEEITLGTGLSLSGTTLNSGAGAGDVTSNTATSVDSELALFNSTTGKSIKRATTTGILKGTSGVLSAAVAGTDYAPGTSANTTGIVKSTTTTGALTTAVAADFPTLNQNTTGTASTITGSVTESQVTNLVTDLAAKATDSLVVHLAGTETVTGAKTFTANTNVSKSVPEQRQTSNDANYTRINRTDTLNTTTRYNQVNKPASPSNSLVFNGSTQRMTIPYFNIGTSISYEMWFKYTSGSDLFSYMGNLIRVTATSIQWLPNISAGLAPSTTLTVGAGWHHLIITQTGATQYNMYFDGTQAVTNGTVDQAINTANNSNALGSYNGSLTYNGEFDEVRIYSKVLSAAEASSHWNAGAGTYGAAETSLEIGYHLDGDATDYSGNARTGTLVGSPTFGTGKVTATASLLEVPVWSSTNGFDANEEGIHTFSTPAGGAVIQGQTIKIRTNAIERVRVDNSGNLGIGTTSPAYPLDVSGTARASTLLLTTPLALGSGGTGSATQNFVDLTTTQTVGGAKTFTAATVIDTSNATPLNVTDTSTAVNQVPIMTSNIAPSGTAFASTAANSSNDAWNIFDNDLTSKWTATAATGSVGYDFGAGNGKMITRYTITGPISGQETFGPKTWTFEGSPDGTTYSVLDTQTNVAAWTALLQRTYNFTNTTSYRYYRINCTLNQGGSNLSWTESQFLQFGVNVFKATKTQIDLGNPAAASLLLNTAGSTVLSANSLQLGNASTATIKSTKELILRQDGDLYGTTIFRLQNRSGFNGASIESANLELIDLITSTPTGTSTIRFEHRNDTNTKISGNGPNGEVQFGPPGSPNIVIGSSGSAIISGSFGIGNAAPNSKLHVSGPIATAIANKTAAYTITATDSVITADATTAAFTVTLPTAVGCAGRQYTVKRTNTGANAVTVGTTSAQTIDGSTTAALNVRYQSLTVVSDNANWQVI